MPKLLSPEDVLVRIEAAVQAAGSARKLCKQWGVFDSHLSAVRHGRMNPDPKMLEAMQLRRIIRYEPVYQEER